MEEYIYDVFDRDGWWWTVGRRALVRRLWGKHGDGREGLNVLDIGCGPGGTLKELEQLGTGHGMDVSKTAVKYCRERGVESVCVADASQLPYRDEKFDLVVEIDVLEHVEDDVASLEEVYRVCRPGGTLILTVPAFQFLWSRRDEQCHHKRRYTLKEAREKVSKAGFQIVRSTYINLPLLVPLFLLVKVGQLLSRSPSMKVDFVVVPPLVNKILGWVVRAEARWLARANLPIGTAIACVAVKQQKLTEARR